MTTRPLVLSVAIALSIAGCATTAGSDTGTTSGPDAAAAASMSPAHPTDPGQAFSDMDANKDGSLSKDEVVNNEMLTQHFSQVDTDGNGSLSQAEVDAHRASMAGKPS